MVKEPQLDAAPKNERVQLHDAQTHYGILVCPSTDVRCANGRPNWRKTPPLMTFDQSKQLSIAGTGRDLIVASACARQDGDVGASIATFPATRFYGSKRRLLDWIYRCLKDLTFETVLDGFGGTASVSLLFQAMGRKVTFHDGLLSNTIAANALLVERISVEDACALSAFVDAIKPTRGFVSKTFAGMYYTASENRWLDGAATAIHEMRDSGRRSIYLYCLFQACLRKRPFNLFHRANLSLRLNRDVERTFGNWVTWERSFPELMKVAALDLVALSSDQSPAPVILPHGDIAALRGHYDLVYLDPPYVNKSKVTDDYLQRYHFLEGLSQYHDWERRLDLASPLKSLRSCSYIKEWQNRRHFKDRLFGVISAHKRSIVVLSYLAGAFPSQREITAYFKANFRHVRIHKKQLGHALAKSKKTELIFVGSN